MGQIVYKVWTSISKYNALFNKLVVCIHSPTVHRRPIRMNGRSPRDDLKASGGKYCQTFSTSIWEVII